MGGCFQKKNATHKAKQRKTDPSKKNESLPHQEEAIMENSEQLKRKCMRLPVIDGNEYIQRMSDKLRMTYLVSPPSLSPNHASKLHWPHIMQQQQIDGLRIANTHRSPNLIQSSNDPNENSNYRLFGATGKLGANTRLASLNSKIVQNVMQKLSSLTVIEGGNRRNHSGTGADIKQHVGYHISE